MTTFGKNASIIFPNFYDTITHHYLKLYGVYFKICNAKHAIKLDGTELHLSYHVPYASDIEI